MRATSDSDLPAVGAGQLPVTLDTQGRVRVSKEQRRVILAEFERSGLSVPQFAQRNGLKYSTLARWVQLRGETAPCGATPPIPLLEAVVPQPTRTALQVQLPGGAHLEIREASQIPLATALVQALAKSC